MNTQYRIDRRFDHKFWGRVDQVDDLDEATETFSMYVKAYPDDRFRLVKISKEVLAETKVGGDS